MRLLRLLGTLAAVAVGASVHAQTTFHASWSKIVTGSWTFNPIYAQENATPGAVHSFLALAETGATTGNNIVAVWYKRGAAGTWTTKSWTVSDPWVAVKSVKLELGIPNSEDERWSVPFSNTTATEESTDYVAGVLATDPLAELVAGSPDRDQMIEFLTAIGYPAANIPVEETDECTTNEKLEGFALEVEGVMGEAAQVQQSVDDPNAATFLTLNSGEICDFVIAGPPRIRPRPAVPTSLPYTNPPGVAPGGSPPGPGWTPGAWSPWRCRSVPIGGGAINCVCTHKRRWGRWEIVPCWSGACTIWREVIETETCTDVNATPPCPAVPNPATYNCTATTPY